MARHAERKLFKCRHKGDALRGVRQGQLWEQPGNAAECTPSLLSAANECSSAGSMRPCRVGAELPAWLPLERSTSFSWVQPLVLSPHTGTKRGAA